MWYAATETEANFVFDLLFDRRAHKTMLDYARWLEKCGKHKEAEFLRLELSPSEHENRLLQFRQELDARWLGTVTAWRFRPGDVVRIVRGTCEGFEATIGRVDPRTARADVMLHIIGTPWQPTWISFCDLELLTPAPQDEHTSGHHQ